MLSRTVHLRMAACLREAKQYLHDGSFNKPHKVRYICDALRLTKASPVTKGHCLCWVKKQLKGVGPLEVWLVRHHTDYLALREYAAVRRLQITRQAWLDDMIKCLED